MLTDRYLQGIPDDLRVAVSGKFLNEGHITRDKLAKISKLNDLANQRGLKLAHMAFAWLLRDKRVSSVLIGSSKPEQIVDSISALHNTIFSDEELTRINSILNS